MSTRLDLKATRRTVLGGIGAGAAMAAGGGIARAAGRPAGAPAVRQNLPEEFVVANELEPPDLMPGFAGYGPLLVTRQLYQTLVEPRITLDEAGQILVEEVPSLAERYEQVDPLRYRFFLRPDVRFHNREPFDATAVKASFDVQTDEELLAQLNRSNTLGRAVAACEIVDPMTVDFVATQPDNEIPLSRLRGMVLLPPKLLADAGFLSLAEQPVGTGPYRFESWTRGQDIRMRLFEEYWNPDGPNMPAVRFIVRTEASVRAQTVAAGEAHLAYNIGFEQAQAIEKSVVGGGFQSTGIRLNNTKEPTSNPLLRKALNLAVDRQAIIDGIFYGQATPLAFFGFQPVELEPYPYDPEQARALVEEAGLTGTELELVYGENRIPEEPQLIEVYTALFGEIGLKINPRRVEARQYNDVSAAEFGQQPQMLIETTSSGNHGDIASGLRDKYGCEGSGTFCDPKWDAEFNELAALTGAEKEAKLQSIAERLHLEVYSRVWVAGVQQIHGIAPNVEADLPVNAYLFFDDIRFV